LLWEQPELAAYNYAEPRLLIVSSDPRTDNGHAGDPRGGPDLANLAILPNFRRLVLGCVEGDFCKQNFNMRFAAFFKLFKICALLHRSKFKSLAKHRF